MNQNDWKQDPRLAGMDEQKLRYLSELAEKAGKAPGDKLIPLLMSLASGGSGIDFTDQETDIIVSILTANMNSSQKKKVETLRTLSKRLTGSSRAGKNGPARHK